VSTGSVTTYTWDALNRLTRLDGPTGTHTYGYDPNGIRVRETNDGETTRFLHGREDILATYETDQPDQPGQLATYFTHGPGSDEPWAQAKPGAPEDPLAYLHRDGLGSVTAISTPEAQLRGTTTYAAFGSVEGNTGLQSRYGYTSRELDPTGQMYYRARYYQPDLGRFTTQDSFPGFLNMPASLHSYQYVLNNPARFTDPFGLAVLAAVVVPFVGVAWATVLTAFLWAVAVFIGILIVVFVLVVIYELFLIAIENSDLLLRKSTGEPPPLRPANRPWPPKPLWEPPEDPCEPLIVQARKLSWRGEPAKKVALAVAYVWCKIVNDIWAGPGAGR
ncbi:MAG: RHS repeat domain-containing protein, partial [Thermoanaerobaculia bacterium]